MASRDAAVAIDAILARRSILGSTLRLTGAYYLSPRPRRQMMMVQKMPPLSQQPGRISHVYSRHVDKLSSQPCHN